MVPLKISKDSITEFLHNGWLYEPDTGYDKIFKVFPGSYITYDLKTESLTQTKYFDVSTQKDASTKLKNTSLDKIIDDSIKIQCRSDVPVGAYFSGGIDSSVIVSKAKNLKCISAKYEDQTLKSSGMEDDFIYANEIKKHFNLDPKFINLTKEGSSLQSVRKVVEGIEELNSDFTYIISEKLSFEAKKSNLKVMLSGMGADELFGGYSRYKAVKYRRFYKILSIAIIPFIPLLRKFKSINKKIDRFESYIKEKDFIKSYSSLIGPFSSEEISELIQGKSSSEKYYNKISKILKAAEEYSDYKKAFILICMVFCHIILLLLINLL